MECYYDSLFEVDCGGVDALRRVRCGYDISTEYFFRQLRGYIGWSAVYQDASFQRRLKWIGQCANIANFALHCCRYKKGNISRYFVQVVSIYVPKRMPYGWIMSPMDLAKPSCYYLGTFPNYWNLTNKRIVYAHDLMTPDVYPMENQPVFYDKESIKKSIELREKMNIQGVPGKEYASEDEKKEMNSLQEEFGSENLFNYLYPERMSEDARKAFTEGLHSTYQNIDDAITKMGFFRDKFEITEWLRQKYALDARKQAFDDCIEKYYPKPVRVPQYKIPEGNFPGAPIKEMELPPPTGAPGKPPMPAEKIIRLVFNFWLLTFTTLNGYSLVLTISEETGIKG